MKPKKTSCVNEYFDTLMLCKKYFHEADLINAKKEYYKLNDILQNKLNNFDKKAKNNLTDLRRQLIYQEFQTIIDCLTYEELYTLTNHRNWLLTDCEIEEEIEL